MKYLRSLATSTTDIQYALDDGSTVKIASWSVPFPPAGTARLEGTALKSTYTSKPLVAVDGEPLFGELAIVRCFERDGWGALWADTFHGRKFWKTMPHKGSPVRPPDQVLRLYSRIAERKGNPSGCFDVVGWTGERIVWAEYKGPRDKPNKNEQLWVRAALECGVRPDDLLFIGATGR